MRKLVLLSLLLVLQFAARHVQAQAQIDFRNNAATAVTNCLTGTRVVGGGVFRAGLYVGPVGSPESALVLVAATNIINAVGIFTGGIVTLPGVPPGQPVFVQVRVWETAYGTTYEQALAAGCIGGRPSLTGKSVVFQVIPTEPPNPPPQLGLSGLNPIVVCLPPCVIDLQCPASFAVECTNATGNLVNFSATAVACCSNVLPVTCAPLSGSRFRPGVTPVTCTATDATSGQSNSCTFTITVRDTSPPAITCPANRVVECTSPAGTVVTFAASATDACDTNVTLSCVPPSGTTFPPGVTTVRCTATDDATNAATCTFTVTVRDTSPPVVGCPANATVECGGTNGTRVTFSAGAADNCDTNLLVVCVPPSGSFFPPGVTTIRCTSTDNATNSASCTFTITVRDTTPPRLTCSGDLTVQCATNAVVVSYLRGATDNCDPAVPINCTPPSGSPFPLGTNTVNCSARDSAGNTATCSFRVIVLPTSVLTIERAVIVRWECGGVLQGADNVDGPWVDIPGAANPYCVPASQARRFYRTRN